MKILLTHRFYHPVLGGTIVLLDCIAQALTNDGHEVRITTKTPQGEKQNSPGGTWPVQRTRNFMETCQWVRWADRVIMIEQSLFYSAAAWLFRKPSVTFIQSWFHAPTPRTMLILRVQRWLTSRIARFVAPSQKVADSWGCVHSLVPNGYDPAVFKNTQESREYDFGFLGRFHHDKGPDLFLEALATLKRDGMPAKAVMIGEGPILERCLEIAGNEPELQKSVTFVGSIQDRREIAGYLNRVKVLVIPNRWEEPFGMVALEGLACGCKLVSTESGGLRDATGGHTLTVPKSDPQALAAAMRCALDAADGVINEEVRTHLIKHHWSHISRNLLAHTDPPS